MGSSDRCPDFGGWGFQARSVLKINKWALPPRDSGLRVDAPEAPAVSITRFHESVPKLVAVPAAC